MFKQKNFFQIKDAIDTEIVDRNGKKAIDLAQTRGFSHIVDYIDRYRRARKNYINIK